MSSAQTMKEKENEKENENDDGVNHQELLEGMRGFLRFAIENDKVTKEMIIGTLLHDINGTLHKDVMMLPRTDPYRTYGERR